MASHFKQQSHQPKKNLVHDYCHTYASRQLGTMSRIVRPENWPGLGFQQCSTSSPVKNHTVVGLRGCSWIFELSFKGTRLHGNCTDKIYFNFMDRIVALGSQAIS